jgi:type II secretory pathway pseudopilin PulG
MYWVGGGVTVARRTQDLERSGRLRVLELLIVAVIVIVVAVIAIPAFASQAKKTVLQRNADTLALQVKSQIALEDCTPTLGAALVADLRSGELGEYVNPCSGSRAIVSADAPTASAITLRPAVLVTDEPQYTFKGFSPSAATKSRLAGTLIVSISTSGGASTVDVYYVDLDGGPSPSPSALAISGEAALVQ